MGKDVIIACDFSSAQQTFDFLDKFTEEKPFVKIGMELFYAEGPSIVREIKKRGHKIFLDLKLHDIPNTVKKSMAVLSKLDVDMTNVHAAGTIDWKGLQGRMVQGRFLLPLPSLHLQVKSVCKMNFLLTLLLTIQ